MFRPKLEHGAVTLTQRKVFILPTRQGFALVVVLVLMTLGNINYNLSLGYVLTFLLAMVALMSMLHAFRNLAHLEIRPGHADAVFNGELAKFVLHFHNPSKLARYHLCLRDNEGHSIAFDAAAMSDNAVAFPLSTTQRGWLKPGLLTLYTEFPLGLFHAWSYLHFDTSCLVYARPVADAPLPLGNAPEGAGKYSVAGDEDFAGLRNYVAGDAMPRISWKSFARGHSLQVKQFSMQVGEELWLDFADAPARDVEEKLAWMTRWVLDAEEQSLRYGLRLPDSELPPNSGVAQRDECLRRLALHNLPQQSQQSSVAR